MLGTVDIKCPYSACISSSAETACCCFLYSANAAASLQSSSTGEEIECGEDAPEDVQDEIDDESDSAGVVEEMSEFRTDLIPNEDLRRNVFKLGDEIDIRNVPRDGSVGEDEDKPVSASPDAIGSSEPILGLPMLWTKDRRRMVLRCSSMLCSAASASAWVCG